MAVNSSASVLVSGSSERVSTHAIGLLRIWDPRTGEKVGRLKGHTDNVRCVLVSEDGTKCISGTRPLSRSRNVLAVDAHMSAGGGCEREGGGRGLTAMGA